MSFPPQGLERIGEASETGLIWYSDSGYPFEAEAGAVAHDDSLRRERRAQARVVNEQPVRVRRVYEYPVTLEQSAKLSAQSASTAEAVGEIECEEKVRQGAGGEPIE
jgi:hypothetical protein